MNAIIATVGLMLLIVPDPDRADIGSPAWLRAEVERRTGYRMQRDLVPLRYIEEHIDWLPLSEAVAMRERIADLIVERAEAHAGRGWALFDVEGEMDAAGRIRIRMQFMPVKEEVGYNEG